MSRSDLPADRYTRTAIVLHWTVAALALAQFAWGWWMTGIPKSPPGVRADAFNLHKSMGLVIFALMVARLAWRAGHPAPPRPLRPLEAHFAAAVQALLYVALFALPLSGYLGSVWSGYPIKWFGLPLPMWGTKSPVLKDLMSAVHLAAGWTLAGLVVLHVAGALRHALAGDGIVARMRFGPRALRGGGAPGTPDPATASPGSRATGAR